MKSADYSIMIYKEVTPKIKGKPLDSPHHIINLDPEIWGDQLDLYRPITNLNSDVLLYRQRDKFKYFSDLISELCLETPSKAALDVLVENYIETRSILISKEDPRQEAAMLSSALTNIARTPIEAIEERMISSYEGGKKENSTALGVTSLFAIKNSDGMDITSQLAGKLTPSIITQYVDKFKNELIDQLSKLPHIPLIEKTYCNAEDYKEKIKKFLMEEYQNDISSILNEITALKNQIFTKPKLTKVYFALEFNKQKINEIVQEEVDKLIPGVAPRSVSPRTVANLFSINNDSDYSKENIALVSDIQKRCTTKEDDLKIAIIDPFSCLNRENTAAIKHSLTGYGRMYQLLIFAPYR